MKKKVLFVIRELTGGGAERALSNIVTHFPDDWDIDIVLNDLDHIEYPYKGNILPLNIPEPRNRKSWIYQIKVIVLRIRYLRKVKKKNGYDACISFLDSSNIANVLSGNRYCKTIVSIRRNMISEFASKGENILSSLLIELFYKKADMIVTCSKEIEDEIRDSFYISKNKLITITNGYDAKLINEKAGNNPQNIDINLLQGRRIVSTVGRLCEEKGQWHLIRAFSDVVKTNSDVVLLIIGSGELKPYFEKLIDQYNLKENVLLLGYCKNPFFYVKRSDVFVLPSMIEGFPNALAEAVCCGIPCIATDFKTGAREILEIQKMDKIEMAGVIVPLCSGRKLLAQPLEVEEEKLADTIIELLKDETKREYYINQCKIKVADMDINKKVKQWIKICS